MMNDSKVTLTLAFRCDEQEKKSKIENPSLRQTFYNMSNDTFLEKIKGTTTQLINISGGAVKILYNQVLGDVAASSNVLEFVKSMTAASKPSNKSTIDTSSTRPRLTLPSQDNLDIRLFYSSHILIVS